MNSLNNFWDSTPNGRLIITGGAAALMLCGCVLMGFSAWGFFFQGEAAASPGGQPLATFTPGAGGSGIPTATLAAGVLTLVLGTAVFCALAFAATAVLPTANFAAAVTMTSTLVLYFLSGLFAREDNIGDTLRTIAGLFPVKPLFEALVVVYDPATTGAGFYWRDLAVLAAWGIGGLILGLRFFRWTPSTG